MVTFLSEFYRGVSERRASIGHRNVLHIRYADSLVIWVVYVKHLCLTADRIRWSGSHLSSLKIVLDQLQFSPISYKFIPPMNIPSYPVLIQTVFCSNWCQYYYTQYESNECLCTLYIFTGMSLLPKPINQTISISMRSVQMWILIVFIDALFCSFASTSMNVRTKSISKLVRLSCFKVTKRIVSLNGPAIEIVWINVHVLWHRISFSFQREWGWQRDGEWFRVVCSV